MGFSGSLAGGHERRLCHTHEVRGDASSGRCLSSNVAGMGLMGLLWGAAVLLPGSFPLVGVAGGAAVDLRCVGAMGTLHCPYSTLAPPASAGLDFNSIALFILVNRRGAR
jgi:hypothetical protein